MNDEQAFLAASAELLPDFRARSADTSAAMRAWAVKSIGFLVSGRGRRGARLLALARLTS